MYRPDWIAERTVVTDAGCWEWTASTNLGGYASIRRHGQSSGHRAAYIELVGPIPSGLDLDHLCRNRACVNPEHLEPVTRSENLRRSALVGRFHLSKTHCPAGHAYDDDNTYRRPDGHRQCKTCGVEATRRWRERNARPHGTEGRYRSGCSCVDCARAHERWRQNLAASHRRRSGVAS